MYDSSLALLVEAAAVLRGEDSVPRGFIVEALELVESGQKTVPMYPSGAPSLKAIYDLALCLYTGTLQN